MQNFTYYNPTKLIFGQATETQIGAEMAQWATGTKKLLVVYGGGSAVRSGLLDRVTQSCEAAGLTVVTKGGVQPNPTVEFVRECIEVARAEGVDALLAVGGGSVIDTVKAVAMGVPYAGDVWDFYCGKAHPETALPVGCVLTIPAAGSEQSIRTVITNGTVKAGAGTNVIRPKVSVINPELFYTLPQKQVSAGVIDMMSHIMERYFTNTEGVDFTSGQAEAALRSIMRNAVKLMDNQHDYDAWAQIGLAGSFAHNGYYGLGFEEDWACHGMEHALSGWDPSITHGDGLAAITPSWMSYVWAANPERFDRFAKEVFAVDTSVGDTESHVQMAVAKFKAFLMLMNLPTQMSHLTDKEIPIKEIAAAATKNGPLGHFRPLEEKDVEAILRSAL
ncbi:MAG: iron-containing alcohol dehydrogenase [Sutterellaceae bacterium]|nr:iron-containing alcohol dehydrogenase [Sutterellaceae bacterium]